MHASRLLRAVSAAALAGLLWTSAPALAAETAIQDTAPQRSVVDRVLTSTSLPRVRIEVDPAFKYVGTQSFTLYGVAQAEQHFFVDADEQGRIRRLYWIQFEGFLPGNTHAYDYPVTQQTTVGDVTFIADASASNIKVAPPRAGSDSERALTFLTNSGYRTAHDETLVQRLVHLIGADRRNELMIIYAEVIEEPGLTAAALAKDGAAADRWPAVAAGVLERARKGLVIAQQ